MRVLVVGATGMLGHKLCQQWKERFEVWATVRGDASDIRAYGIFDEARVIGGVDAFSFPTVRTAIERVRPDVIFNAVGVIKQLPSSKNVVTTLTINSIFPHLLAEAAREFGAKLVCISTDCVFDGKKGGYVEDDVADATDLYGRSKLFGEVTTHGCLTVRTSIIGRELGHGHSLVEWFLSNRGRSVKGFAKAIYSGFPTIVIADIIGDLIAERPDLSGLFQISSDPIDKYSLLGLLNEAYDAGAVIERDEDFCIDRSLNSDRFRAATGFRPAPWSEMIARMAADPTPYDSWKK